MTALQNIGEVLVDMPQSQLDKIPLPDELLEAIHLARTLKTGEPKRRQLQHVGKLMRHIDVEPIQAAMNKVQLTHTRATTQCHEAEEWCERLVTEGDNAIQTFVSLYLEADRQTLRQLVRRAQHHRKIEGSTGVNTALFRYVRIYIR